MNLSADQRVVTMEIELAAKDKAIAVYQETYVPLLLEVHRLRLLLASSPSNA